MHCFEDRKNCVYVREEFQFLFVTFNQAGPVQLQAGINGGLNFEVPVATVPYYVNMLLSRGSF